MGMNTETILETSRLDWRAAFQAACEHLPAQVAVPPHLTPEGERLTKFKKICPDRYLVKVDPAKLPNPEAFYRVAKWAGTYPGPCATGATGTAKTLASFSAMGSLYVKGNRPFAWFPVRRLVTELEGYEAKGCADEFFRNYAHYPVLMVDDIDKINWQFESQQAMLFSFYDWVYRCERPCITTTNKPRAWWADRMGDAFARRLFNDAHFEVRF